MVRRVVAGAAAVLAVWSAAAVGAAAPALAYAPSPVTTPTVPPMISGVDKVGLPAAAIVSVLGAVTPTSGAQNVAQFQMNRLASGNSVIGGVNDAVKIASNVPGFQFGYKIGGWIDTALGVTGGTQPDPSYVPYSGENVQPSAAGWSHGNVFRVQQTATANQMGLDFTVTLGWSTGATFTQAQAPSVKLAASVTGTATPFVGQGTTCANGTGVGNVDVYPTFTNSSSTLTDGTGTTVSLGVMCNGSGGVVLGVDPNYGDVNGPLAGSCGCAGIVGAGVSVNAGRQAGYDSAGPFEVDTPAQADTTAFWQGVNVPGVTTVLGQTRSSSYVASDLAGAPPGTSPTPMREVAVTGKFSDGTSSVAYSAPFKETDPAYPAWPEIPAVGSHGYLSGWSVDIVDPANAGVVIKHIADWSAPAPLQTAENYTQCQNANCVTTLWKVGTGGALVDCFSSPDQCVSWSTDPNKTADYQCTYGPAGGTQTTLTLADCTMYGPTFDPQQRAKGIEYSDPAATGNPGTGALQTPSPVTDISVQAGSSSTDCFPSGWNTFNPLAWVYLPVKCVLVWAFVPDATVVETSVSQARTTMMARPPFSLVQTVWAPVSGFVNGVTTPCTSALADFHYFTVPCAPPGPPAWFSAMYLIEQIAMVIMTAFGVWRLVEAGLAPK